MVAPLPLRPTTFDGRIALHGVCSVALGGAMVHRLLGDGGALVAAVGCVAEAEFELPNDGILRRDRATDDSVSCDVEVPPSRCVGRLADLLAVRRLGHELNDALVALLCVQVGGHVLCQRLAVELRSQGAREASKAEVSTEALARRRRTRVPLDEISLM